MATLASSSSPSSLTLMTTTLSSSSSSSSSRKALLHHAEDAVSMPRSNYRTSSSAWRSGCWSQSRISRSRKSSSSRSRAGDGRIFIMASSNYSSAAAPNTQKPGKEKEDAGDANVVQVHTVKQFEEALEAAKNRLVVVEYAASHSQKSRKIYPTMVELSSSCPDAVFLLVMGDESAETKELCKRANIDSVPHFIFYKNKEIVHEEEGIGPEELLGDVLYYGDPADNPILQLHSRQELKDLIAANSDNDKLLVLDVGLKHCGPCVKVYPTVVKLARKMRDSTVFARINGDENDDLMEVLKGMKVVQVPTFVFIRGAKTLGRYVGSGRGELIGEILRYQGVRVTY